MTISRWCVDLKAWLALTVLLCFSTLGHASQIPELTFEQAAARLAQGGYVLMMRHARTVPGIGDPENFRIDDCSTQRNLSTDGREQARAIGAAIRRSGIRIDQVRSSQWCRCRETAQLAFSKSQDWPALNSFFADRSSEAQQTRQLLAGLAAWQGAGNLMLVTHQVNINGATGVYAGQGEIIAARLREAKLHPEFRFGEQK